MDEIIKNLKELTYKHETQLSQIREKLRIIDTIPKAKALDGKCFKYKNGFTFGGKRQGWSYKRVIAVVGENILVDTFQTEGSGKVEFHFSEVEYVSRFSHPGFIPISKKQYFKQLNNLLSLLKKRGFYGK